MSIQNKPRPPRSSLLAIVLDEKRFQKAVASSADSLNLDLEDAVTAADKIAARKRVVEIVNRGRAAIGGRDLIVRINDLFSPWGRDDLETVARLDLDVIIYPQARSAEEVWAVRRTLEEHGSRATIRVILETPQAFLNLNDIARVPGVSSLVHGAGDLTLETGIAVSERSSLDVTATQTVLAARAYGLAVLEGMHLDDFRNPDAVRAYAHRAKRQGFDGLNSFYEPHIAIINEVMTPSPAEVEFAGRVVEAYEKAQAEGRPATVLDGKAILIHQYKKALKVLATTGAASLSKEVRRMAGGA